mmetsp:Transcript_68376/g.120734  ORF Transcript_68376/g.120734 Transcript_68376/m.120734 type:complete len:238 (-) Transcript_68376:106-819(-)
MSNAEILCELTELQEPEGQHAAEDKLMIFEQTPIHPAEDRHAGRGDEALDPLVDIIGGLRPVDCFLQETQEGVERILVHVLDDTQLVHQEEEHGAFCSDRSVELARMIDFNLRTLRLRHLHRNFSTRLLGLLEALDERQVIQYGGRICIGELGEQGVFQPAQDDLELVLLSNQGLLLFFQLGLLAVHNHCKDLLLKTLWRHDEIHDCALRRDLWTEFRIWQLGLQVELELGIVLDLI